MDMGLLDIVLKQKNLIRYAKNQEEYHKKQHSADQLKQILGKLGIEYDEKYFI